MKYICTFILALFLLLIPAYKVHPVEATLDKANESSAHFRQNVSLSTSRIDRRRKNLERIFSIYNSPLFPYIDEILDAADMYDLNWRLIAAISGVESGFCHHIPVLSYNCWGWANGKYYFTDYPSAIYSISRSIRLSYIERGIETLSTMSSIYAPPSLFWSTKVRLIMNQIDTYDDDLSLLQITI